MNKRIKDPSKAKNKKKLPLHPAELVWYCVCGAVGLWGLTYIVLGLVAENLPITAEDNEFVEANAAFAKTFGLDWLGWGLIILAIAAVCAAVTLLLLSNKADRDYEKTTRRAARMAQLDAEEAKEEAELAKQEGEVVDAEVAPVEEPIKEPAQEAEPEESNEQVDEAEAVGENTDVDEAGDGGADVE